MCQLVLELLHSTHLLLAVAVVVQSNPHIAPQVIYQKLEDALSADKGVLYRMQVAFFPFQSLSQDLVYLNVCVTVDVQHENCDNFSLPGGQSNFSYCQDFQWSSSALSDLISIDQLVILDNVISESIIRIVWHRKHLEVNSN